MGGTLPPGTFLIHLRDAGEECPRPSGVSPLSARSAYSAGARGRSPEGSAAEAKRMRRQTAKDDRARRRRTGGTPSRAQGVRQRADGAFPRRRRRSPKGLPFLLRQAIPGLRRACSSLACAAYLPYASALAPALARLASGLPCLATKPFRGQAPCSGARMPRYLRDGALAMRIPGESVCPPYPA